jgi:hypothetical protein
VTTLQHSFLYELEINPDFSFDTDYPTGNKPPTSDLSINLAAFNADMQSLQNLPVATAVSLDYRTYLEGTDAATAPLSVLTVSGTDADAGGWSISTSGDDLINPAGGVAGQGVLVVQATDHLGNVVAFPQQVWSIVAPSGTDTMAPTVPTGLAITPVLNALNCTIDAPSDNYDDGITPSGPSHCNVYLGGVKATPPSPVDLAVSLSLALTATNIGSMSPLPTAVQLHQQWTLTAAGIGFNQTPSEQCLFVGDQESGDAFMIVKVNAFTSANEYSTAGIMIRETLAQGARFAAWYLQPASTTVVAYDYYISPSGNDSNPGSQSSPWALTAINTKQSIYQGKRVGVLPGTYNCLSLMGGSYTGDFSTPAFFIAGGTSSAQTIIQSTIDRGAILDGGANATNNPNGQPLIGNVGSGCQYITLDGFEIKNCYNRAISLGYQTAAFGGYSGPLSFGIVVQNCYVHAITNTLPATNPTAITIYSANGAIVQNNYITDIEDTYTRGDAIEFWTSQNSIAQYNSVIATGLGMYAGIVNKNASNYNNIIRFNFLDLTLAAPISEGAIVMDSDGSGATTDQCYNNIIISDYPIGSYLISTGNFPASLNDQAIFNNTIVGVPNFANVGVYRLGAAATISLYNNVVARGSTGYRGDLNTLQESLALIDFNLWPSAPELGLSANVGAGGSVGTPTLYTSLGAFAAALPSGCVGKEAHSVLATASFVNSSLGTAAGYALVAGSAGSASGSNPGRVGGVVGGALTDMGAWGNGATQIGYVAPVSAGVGLGLQLKNRLTTGGNGVNNGSVPGIAGPVWLKVQRSGTTLTFFYNLNGTKWTNFTSITLSMNQVCSWGLVLASQTAGVPCSCVFSEVNLNDQPAVSFTIDTTVAEVVTVTSVDADGNESAPCNAVTATPLGSAPSGITKRNWGHYVALDQNASLVDNLAHINSDIAGTTNVVGVYLIFNWSSLENNEGEYAWGTQGDAASARGIYAVQLLIAACVAHGLQFQMGVQSKEFSSGPVTSCTTCPPYFASLVCSDGAPGYLLATAGDFSSTGDLAATAKNYDPVITARYAALVAAYGQGTGVSISGYTGFDGVANFECWNFSDETSNGLYFSDTPYNEQIVQMSSATLSGAAYNWASLARAAFPTSGVRFTTNFTSGTAETTGQFQTLFNNSIPYAIIMGGPDVSIALSSPNDLQVFNGYLGGESFVNNLPFMAEEQSVRGFVESSGTPNQATLLTFYMTNEKLSAGSGCMPVYWVWHPWDGTQNDGTPYFSWSQVKSFIEAGNPINTTTPESYS